MTDPALIDSWLNELVVNKGEFQFSIKHNYLYSKEHKIIFKRFPKCYYSELELCPNDDSRIVVYYAYNYPYSHLSPQSVGLPPRLLLEDIVCAIWKLFARASLRFEADKEYTVWISATYKYIRPLRYLMLHYSKDKLKLPLHLSWPPPVRHLFNLDCHSLSCPVFKLRFTEDIVTIKFNEPSLSSS